MKFYGLEIGCNKVLKAEKGTEVVSITTFGEDVTQTLVASLRPISLKLTHQGEYIDCPATSPETSRIRSLNEERKRRTHHVYHYLVADYLLQSFLNTVRLKLPPHDYIKLSNE